MMNAMVGETKSSGMDQGLELAEQKSENSRMTEKENEILKKENRRLQKENEILLDTVAQMKVTRNRLIKRYVIEGPKH